jgi:hypothetical protein
MSQIYTPQLQQHELAIAIRVLEAEAATIKNHLALGVENDVGPDSPLYPKALVKKLREVEATAKAMRHAKHEVEGY